MHAVVRVLTLLLGLIGLATGLTGVLSGVPGAEAVLDNTFRFQSGIWLAVGLGLVHSAVAYEDSEQLFRFLMRALVVGGIARAVGLVSYAPEPPIIAAIVIEIVVPVLLLVLHARARTTRALPRNGKRVLVTGANGGLGSATVAALVRDGFDHVVMATRTREKGERARAQIIDAIPGADDRLSVASGFDMTDPKSIRTAVDALAADEAFDAVFLQAGGAVYGDTTQTIGKGEEAMERTVFQNVFGAHVVLSNLVRRGLVARGARVVFAGGEGARGIPGLIAKPEFPTPTSLETYLSGRGDGPYNPFNALGVSKFVGALWVGRLASTMSDAFSTIWFSPGLTGGTRGLRGAPAFRRVLAERVVFPVMGFLGLAQSPKAGARKYADCISGAIGGNGEMIGAPAGKALGTLVDQTPMHSAMTDPALRDVVWTRFEALAGPFGEAPLRATAGRDT